MNPEDVALPHPGKYKSGNVDRSKLGKGEYADYFEVGNDYVAFYVDCGQQGFYKGETTKVYTRIATSPFGAINLLGVLAKALCEYAKTYEVFRDDNGMLIPKEREMRAALCKYVRDFIEPEQLGIDK